MLYVLHIALLKLITYPTDTDGDAARVLVLGGAQDER